MEILKITAPDGYEIDKQKSTIEEIVFKAKESELPKESRYIPDDFFYNHKFRNIYRRTDESTPEESFFKLIILRDYYNDGWLPDWNDDTQNKSTISFAYGDFIQINNETNYQKVLSFKTSKLRDEFLRDYKDLILKAKELL